MGLDCIFCCECRAYTMNSAFAADAPFPVRIDKNLLRAQRRASGPKNADTLLTLVNYSRTGNVSKSKLFRCAVPPCIHELCHPQQIQGCNVLAFVKRKSSMHK